MPSRAVSPVVGVVLLVALTVALGAAVGLTAVVASPPEPPPSAAVSLDVDAGQDRLSFVHRGGDALDTRTLRLRVTVAGERLAHQPPVPFFAARGFASGPTGPFNLAADPTWTPGERASLVVAGTNDPSIDPGDTVVVDVYADGTRIARLTAEAE